MSYFKIKLGHLKYICKDTCVCMCFRSLDPLDVFENLTKEHVKKIQISFYVCMFPDHFKTY